MDVRVKLDDDDVARIARAVVELMRADAPPDEWMTTAAAARYLSMTPNAMHKLTSARQIPFSQDRPGGRCHFRRSDLDAWRESQRHGAAR